MTDQIGGKLRVMYPATLTPGGAERQLLLLAEHLPRDRFEISFVMLLGMTEMGRHAQRLGATVHALGAPRRGGQAMPIYAVKAAGQIASYVGLSRREHFDIVDAWLYLGYGLAAVTRPASRVPILIAGRRSLGAFKSEFGLIERAVDSLARRSADMIVANSQAVAEDTIRREGVDPRHIRVIRNGVVMPPVADAARRRAIRAELGVPDDGRPVVGCVGTFKPGKGQARVVHVMAALRNGAQDAWLVFVGDGPDREGVEKTAHDVGLERVRFLGTVPDARHLYDGMDVAISASDAEGLPNVLLEAAAAGLPIVATSAGGTTEIVIDGKTGLLAPVGDTDGLVRALARIVKDPELAGRLGKSAREHVAQAFAIERFVSETAALYEELHARRRA